MYDLMIVGGGPAGMTAAVYAARKRVDTLLLAQEVGGQAGKTAGIENYMGYQYIEGPELMQKFEEQVRQFPLKQIVGQEAVGLSRVGSAFELLTASGESYQAKAAIIATGKRPRQLNVPGEERLLGRGVSYCVICDGPLFDGQDVVIIGGGNSALEAALDMVKVANHIYLVANHSLTGDAILIERLHQASNVTILLEHDVVRIDGDKVVESVTLKDRSADLERAFPATGVFVEIGLIPNSEFASGLVRLNELREIQINCCCETGVPGLFAAGDVTSVPEKQIVVAAGEGAKAALQAHHYLRLL